MVRKGSKLKRFIVTGITKKGKKKGLGQVLGFKKTSAQKSVNQLFPEMKKVTIRRIKF